VHDDLKRRGIKFRLGATTSRLLGATRVTGIVLGDGSELAADLVVIAVGECVQHRGRTFGLVAPLFEQARVCATFLAERSVRGYRDHAERGIYKRLVIAHDKIRGAILYGDIHDGHWYLDLIEKGRDIRDIRDDLLFGESKQEQPPADKQQHHDQ
jgi:nitrite reductase (NADH) large subunit